MLPNLPKEFFWRDLKPMDEFFMLEPVSRDFYEVFSKLNEDQFDIPAVKVFNEVFYQITRMVYEKPLPEYLPKYVNLIKNDLGWNYSVELVMSLVYWLLLLKGLEKVRLAESFVNKIEEWYSNSFYWNPFRQCYAALKNSGVRVNYSFNPRPIRADVLGETYVPWDVVTRDYDLSCIERVLKLWKNRSEKEKIAQLLSSHINNEKDLSNAKIDIQQFLPKVKLKNKEKESSSLTFAQKIVIEKITKENAMLKSRITELETETETLKSFYQTPEKTQERSFSLPLIADYCKKRVTWGEAKEIVAMLNKLLGNDNGGTEEEKAIVDSIEDYFRERMNGPRTEIHGDYVGEMHIDNQVNGVSAGGTGVSINNWQ